jgi:hypothetical protein
MILPVKICIIGVIQASKKSSRSLWGQVIGQKVKGKRFRVQSSAPLLAAEAASLIKKET